MRGCSTRFLHRRVRASSSSCYTATLSRRMRSRSHTITSSRTGDRNMQLTGPSWDAKNTTLLMHEFRRVDCQSFFACGQAAVVRTTVLVPSAEPVRKKSWAAYIRCLHRLDKRECCRYSNGHLPVQVVRRGHLERWAVTGVGIETSRRLSDCVHDDADAERYASKHLLDELNRDDAPGFSRCPGCRRHTPLAIVVDRAATGSCSLIIQLRRCCRVAIVHFLG